MHFKTLYILCIFLLGQAFAQSPNPQIQQYADWVEAAFDKEKALETTAYVAQFWRLPGNPGYDSSIFKVRDMLVQAGYVAEEKVPNAPLTYRIESRTMDRPSWSPEAASITLEDASAPLMTFQHNRNMIAIRSTSTPMGGVTAKVVWLKDLSAKSWDQNMKGKIVFCEASPFRFYAKARKKGAIGILAYRMPGYNQPDKNDTLVSFSSLPTRNPDGGWGIFLSKSARDQLVSRLKAGMKRVTVNIKTTFHNRDELCIIANIRGQQIPNERLVFSAHVQEPGANDNASGVGCLTEMASVAAQLWLENKVRPARTMTFYWGNEISGIHRYLSENKKRTAGILWGISLDMVGEDTEKTGGTFLIEKMPDPSAIWLRGEDKHTEWGAAQVNNDDLFPHYLNDFLLNRCLERASATDWVVKTNPYEGGSDHIPFLKADKPAVLFWHFTDQFYHTDGDLIDKVSATTLSHVGVSSLVSALALCNADTEMAGFIISELEQAASRRLTIEIALSQQAMPASSFKQEAQILQAWTDWYLEALQKCEEIPSGGADKVVLQLISESKKRIEKQVQEGLATLK